MIKYSLIIPHINEWYLLDIMLFSIYNNFKYDDYEIIIVDDWSKNTKDLDFIKNHPLKNKIKLFLKSNLWSSWSRNFWAANAIWEFIIFLDSHMYFKDDFLLKLDNIILGNNNIEILQPIIWSIKDKSVEWKVYKIKDYLLNSTWDSPLLKNESDDIIDVPNIAWWAMVIKRKIFNELWWFNKFFIKWWAEDLEFSMRLYLYWYKLYFSNKIFVAHYFKDSFTNTKILSENVLNNKIVFAYTCFQDSKKLWKILNELLNYYGDIFYKIHKEVLENIDFWIWLEKEKKKYKYNDNSYFNNFKNYYLNF